MSTQSGKYLMLYSTTDGHTKTIMETMAKQIAEATQIHCDIVDINDGDKYALSNYSKVVVGASIRYGYFKSALHQYVNQHVNELNSMPSAFFGVNLTARKPTRNTPISNQYTRKFLQESLWKPQLAGVFAGALWYPRYSFYDRFFIRLIMSITGGETDTSKQIVYTDWSAVQKFASDLVALPATVPPLPPVATSSEASGVVNYKNGVRLAFAVAGISAAVVLGRKFVVSKRR